MTAAPGTHEVRPIDDRTAVPDTGVQYDSTVAPALWFPVAEYLDGTLPSPPQPSILTRSDGVSLFYGGEANSLIGDPESGKSWIADAAAVEVLAQGGRVAIIDLDHNGPASTLSRILALGASRETLRDGARFRYIEPTEQIDVERAVLDLAGERATDDDPATPGWLPDLVIVDSVGELLPMYGASSNSPDEYSRVFARVIKRMTTAGAAVLMVDHLAKNAESRARGATGTYAKRRVIGGLSAKITVRSTFSPGRGGSAEITCQKDRHGSVRKFCAGGESEPLVGIFFMDSRADGSLEWSVRPPQAGDVASDHSPTHVAQVEKAVSALRRLPELPPSIAQARKSLRVSQQVAADALRQLRQEAAATS